MPDFFVAPCAEPGGNCQNAGVVCTSTTNSSQFGLCDDPPPNVFPAYIQHHTPDDWIAVVNNPDPKEVTFKAVDNCVQVVRPNGELESRCDGFLWFDKNLIFLELKDRGTQGWLTEGRQQLTVTIKNFVINHGQDFHINVAYVCNKQRPSAIVNISEQVQMFKDETAVILNRTGALLKADRNINI